ncbi:MAG: hypothetical protein KA745_00030 [Gemmatimonadales bacterium]|nr:hypothetical protein [Gemmatimonadales bacterium]
MMIRASLLALSLATVAGPGSAATWVPVASDMIRTGACGSGGAVVGDGCAPVLYAGQPQIAASGQALDGGWNSQDADRARLTFDAAGAREVRLTIRDFHDQGRSHGRVTAWNGATWDFDRAENGNVHTILLTMPDGALVGFVDFETRRNDGFTVLAHACAAR